MMDGPHSLETLTAIPGSEFEQQRGLLRRILASPQFARADTLQRILRFLFENAGNPDSNPKEYEIAISAVGRRASFDPKDRRHRSGQHRKDSGATPGILRRRGEKRRCTHRSSQGAVSSSIREIGESSTASRRGQNVRRVASFLGGLCGGNAENLLLYSELLFFRDGRGNYFRNIYTNDASVDRKLLPVKLPDRSRRHHPFLPFCFLGARCTPCFRLYSVSRPYIAHC